MILEILGYVSGILIFLTAVPYIRDIRLGKTKPHRTSWFIWVILSLIALFTQLAKGGTFSLLLPAGDALAALIIFLFSIKRGVGGFATKDILALIGAIIGLILWYFTGNPVLALVIIMAVDFLGAILTILKAYKHPETETLVTWSLAGFAGLLAVLSVGKMNSVLLAYPLYICLINSATAIAVLAGRRKNKIK